MTKFIFKILSILYAQYELSCATLTAAAHISGHDPPFTKQHNELNAHDRTVLARVWNESAKTSAINKMGSYGNSCPFKINNQGERSC